MSNFNVYEQVLTAEKKIKPYIRHTPLEHSLQLSEAINGNVYLKCENLQRTNSFKIRGALNKLLSLTQEQSEVGVVTASSGNHGAGVACGLSMLNIPGKIFVPENASPTKIDNIKIHNATLEFYSNDCMETELHAIEYAKKYNMTYVSPYNDIDIVAGQGTVAFELHQQLENIDNILVPIGGGGLISGIAAYIKYVSPKTKVIGCLPQNSPVMYDSIKAGKIIDMEVKPTLSDGTAGGIEPGSITFEICQQYVDDYLLVSEEEIKNAMLNALSKQHMLIEGSSAVALAALINNSEQFSGQNTVVVLSGANTSLNVLKTILI